MGGALRPCGGRVLFYRERDLTSQLSSQPRGCDYPPQPETRNGNVQQFRAEICRHEKAITREGFFFVNLYHFMPRTLDK